VRPDSGVNTTVVRSTGAIVTSLIPYLNGFRGRVAPVPWGFLLVPNLAGGWRFALGTETASSTILNHRQCNFS